MFPRLPARATFVADTNFVSRTQKMFLILFRNILCPQQMFLSLRSPGPLVCLPGPLVCVMYDIVEAIACSLKSALQKWQVHFSII